MKCNELHLILFIVHVMFQVQNNVRTLISVTSLNVHVETYIINVYVQFQELPTITQKNPTNVLPVQSTFSILQYVVPTGFSTM